MDILNSLGALARRTGLAAGACDTADLLAQFKALMATRKPGTVASGNPSARIGFACFGAGVNHLVIDCLLAHALQLRGAACQLLLCDLPELPGCDERLFEFPNNDRCAGCSSPKLPFLEVCGLDWLKLSGVLGDPAATLKAVGEAVASCSDENLTRFRYEGWKVGEWVGSSV